MSFSSPKSRSPPSPLLQQIRKRPFLLFGLPFVGIIVASSFALEGFTQTRYDYQAQKVQSVGREDELGMSKGRRKIDLKEEYYRLNNPAGLESLALDASLSEHPSSSLSSESSTSQTNGSDQNPQIPRAPSRPKRKFSMAPVSQDELENVRVPRPAGVPEWGGVGLAEKSEDAPLKGQRKEDRWV